MSRFSAFMLGSEWLNSTMRLNGALWMAIDSFNDRTVVPSQYVVFMEALEPSGKFKIHSSAPDA